MATAPKNVYVVLLAGGTGTRLWPSSRKTSPKQFARLFSKYTLFQETIRRVKGLVPLSRILVITNKDHVSDIQRQEPLIPEENIIAEPEKKNTALAMGVAAAYVHKRNPNAVIINLATDQVITDIPTYQKTLLAAAKFVDKHQTLTTIGIVPAIPHTGLEYIKLGEPVDRIDGETAYKVDSFIKRPEISDPANPTKKAQEYMKQGNYLWNANKFVWSTKVILEEFNLLAPDLYKNIMNIYNAIGTPQEKGVLKVEYHKAKNEQIDFAIGTKTKKLHVFKGKFGWNDIGDWRVVYELSDKDENGNSIIVHGAKGRHVGIDTKNSLIQTEDQLITTIGIENLVIIDTKDGLLICDIKRAQEVRDIVKILEEKKLDQYL